MREPVLEQDGFDAKRTRAAVLFPQGFMANSPTQPLPDSTKGRFGPFAGQLLVGEMNRSRIARVMLDEVAGELQGACVPFYDDAGLTRGSHRFVFGSDGSLWVGRSQPPTLIAFCTSMWVGRPEGT